MRVCLLTGAFPPQRCGIGDYTERLGCRLAQMGVEVHVVTSAHPSGNRHPTLNVHRVMNRWNATDLGTVLATLHRVKPDVVHLQFPSAGYRRVLLLALMPGILRTLNYRVVVTLHEYTISSRLGRVRQLVMAAGASEVITTNFEDLSTIAARVFWKRDRVHCIHIASNIDPCPGERFDREERRREIGAHPGSPVVCFFGNLHPGKGLEELLEAFGIVSRDLSTGRLLIIGSFSSAEALYSHVIRRKIIDFGLADKVHMTGFITPQKVSQFLLASDVCVLPFRDGLSVRRGSFLAAVRHNLPVITTSPRGPLPDSIIDGENVVLVAPGNVQQLAQSIQRLVRSPDLRKRLRDNTAALDRHFSWAETARRTVEVYGRKENAQLGG